MDAAPDATGAHSHCRSIAQLILALARSSRRCVERGNGKRLRTLWRAHRNFSIIRATIAGFSGSKNLRWWNHRSVSTACSSKRRTPSANISTAICVKQRTKEPTRVKECKTNSASNGNKKKRTTQALALAKPRSGLREMWLTRSWEQIHGLRLTTDAEQAGHQGLRAGLAPALSKIPLELSRSVAADLCRLRTGVWGRLGLAAVAHDRPFTCPCCAIQIRREAGNIVTHLFACPRNPTQLRPGDLWSVTTETLRAAVAHARTFLLSP